MVSLSGCGDSELEQDYTQLKNDFVNLKLRNAKLETRFKVEHGKNKNLQKELTTLRDSNNDLNVSLAKSELFFSRKHKAEQEAERKKLELEKAQSRKEQKNIEKEAYRKAEEVAYNKYFLGFIVLSITILLLLLFLLVMWRRNHRTISDNNKKIKDAKEEMKACENEKIEMSKDLDALRNNIEELKRREQESSKNQVVNAINANQKRRERLWNSVGGIGHGN